MKRFLTLLISIIIFISIFALLLNCSSKKIVISTVSNIYTKDKITNKIKNYIYSSLPELTDREKRQIEDKIINTAEIDLITDKYLNGIIDTILNNQYVEVDITKEKESLFDSLTQNLNTYQKSIVEQEISKIDLNNIYEYTIERAQQNINPMLKTILKTYKIIDSDNFRNVFIIAIICCIGLLILINRSLSKVLMTLSKVLVLFGILSSITTFIINNNIYNLTRKYIGYSFTLDLSILFKFSLFILLLGVLIIIINSVIEKLLEFKHKRTVN